MATTTTCEQAYRVAADEGLADLWWKTGRLRVKASGAETQGAFSQVEVDDPQGCAPPMHIHHGEEETFYVVDGEVTVFADGERIDLSAGDYAFVPRGVDHAYIVRSERARMLITFSPSGFEQFFVQEGIPAEAARSEAPVGGRAADPGGVHPPARARTAARSRARRRRWATCRERKLNGLAARSLAQRGRSVGHVGRGPGSWTCRSRRGQSQACQEHPHGFAESRHSNWLVMPLPDKSSDGSETSWLSATCTRARARPGGPLFFRTRSSLLGGFSRA